MNFEQYVIFGAGEYGHNALSILRDDNVAFFVDNDINKSGKKISNVAIRHFEECKSELSSYKIMVATSQKYVKEISDQLRMVGITEYETYWSVLYNITRKKILMRPDYIGIYDKAVNWIERNTISYACGKAITTTSNLKQGYPEVTGYYIPSLIRWGYRKLAIEYSSWLVASQKEDGSWYDTKDKEAYVFDTAQILKGLLAVRKIKSGSEIDKAIIKAADWLSSHILDNGRFIACDDRIWEYSTAYSELIHLYCLSPIREAGLVFNRQDYLDKVSLSINYYKTNKYEDIMGFGLLSHFYAYVMEALVDLGELAMAKEAMANIAQYQTDDGAVPAYKNVGWVCSTGIFQLALVWFRVGEIERGNKAFSYACKLQNSSGGWFGSYATDVSIKKGEENDYFPTSEISWAGKYFLDALYYKGVAEHNAYAANYLADISNNDQRYTEIVDVVKGYLQSCKAKINILDVGCGKGRYIKNLLDDLHSKDVSFFGADITDKAFAENINKLSGVNFISGSLTNIPFDSNFFDIVYTCEAMEHAVDIKSAVREMARVAKSGGYIIVIDKNIEVLGAFDIDDWEQWFGEEELKAIMLQYCSEVNVVHDVHYENQYIDGLFSAWIGRVE